ncbi:MAG: shikimate dehydrogenase [Methylibium sp. NZG]|nr:MAG: shikimate dehydrogenase [Methylibium sp. NZG]
MDRYAVAGNPVEHSRSPFIHAEFAKQTGQVLHYGRLWCPLDGFENTLRAFANSARDDDAGTTGAARGCNVTVPFKFDAFRLATRHTERAALAGAANTLRFDAEGWLADNTDGCGLVRDIERGAGVALAGKRVLLIGAGGAAAGVLGPLLDAGTAQVVVTNRTLERAQALVARHRTLAHALGRAAAGTAASEVCAVESAATPSPEPTRTPRPMQGLQALPLDRCGEAFDVVINATASSLQGASIPVAAHALAPGALAVDLMYGGAAQAFMQWAEANGAVPRDGLGMLVEQAAESFLLWRDVRPDTAPVLAALRERMVAAA